MDRKVHLQGLLNKQGGSLGGFKTWKKRWCVFHRDGVSWFENEKSFVNGDKELGFLPRDAEFGIYNHDEYAENYFRIVCASRQVIFKAQSHQQKLEWLGILAKVTQELSSVDQAMHSPRTRDVVVCPVELDVVIDPHNLFLSPPSHLQDMEASLSSETPVAHASEPEALSFSQRARAKLTSMFSSSVAPPSAGAALPSQDSSSAEFVGKISSQSLREGWLYKMGHRIQTWKRRYFILLADRLEYYKSHSDKKPQGVIPLSDPVAMCVVTSPKLAYESLLEVHRATKPNEEAPPNPYLGFDSLFFVQPEASGRKFFIAANDTMERDQWLASLQSRLKTKIQYLDGLKPTLQTEHSDAELDRILLRILGENSLAPPPTTGVPTEAQKAAAAAAAVASASPAESSSNDSMDQQSRSVSSVTEFRATTFSSFIGPFGDTAVQVYNGRLLDFLRFASSIYKEEAVLFYLDTDKYRAWTLRRELRAATFELVHSIKFQYLTEDAELCLFFLTPELRQQCCQRVQSMLDALESPTVESLRQSEWNFTEDFFDELRSAALHIIRHEVLPQYLRVEPSAALDSGPITSSWAESQPESRVVSATVQELLQYLISLNHQSVAITTTAATVTSTTAAVSEANDTPKVDSVDYFFRRCFFLYYPSFTTFDTVFGALNEHHRDFIQQFVASHKDSMDITETSRRRSVTVDDCHRLALSALNMISLWSLWYRTYNQDFLADRREDLVKLLEFTQSEVLTIINTYDPTATVSTLCEHTKSRLDRFLKKASMPAVGSTTTVSLALQSTLKSIVVDSDTLLQFITGRSNSQTTVEFDLWADRPLSPAASSSSLDIDSARSSLALADDESVGESSYSFVTHAPFFLLFFFSLSLFAQHSCRSCRCLSSHHRTVLD